VTIIERLISGLSRLPGLGRKSASRIVYYLLKMDRQAVEALARDLNELKRAIERCRVCGNYTDVQPCGICTDPERDRRSLCVVEEPKDVLSIESTREHRGLYHVLMGVISPIDGVGPEDLTVSSLIRRIREEGIAEVVLATNPTVEGDTTALYLHQQIKSIDGVRVSRLALGLPVGGDLEYADRITLARAFRARNTM
jgi:recombination protein RecR